MKKEKKFVKTLMLAIAILLLTIPMVNASEELEWEHPITFSGNNMNYILYFGEGKTASDNQDVFDAPMPPMPPEPFLYGYFKTGLPMPYNKLMYNIKHFPDNYKTWNIKLLSSDNCNVVVSWEKIQDTEYKNVLLKDLETGVTINMKLSTSYEFEIQDWDYYNLQIVCDSKIKLKTLIKKAK